MLQKIRLILRFGVKAMSIFFDLTMELLKGMMALERIFLGEATPQVQTPTPTTLPQTPVPTPTATSTVPPQAPTPISMEPIPPRQETVKCCGGIVVLILLISLATGLQKVIGFIAKIFS